MRSYPSVSRDAVQATLHYAAELAGSAWCHWRDRRGVRFKFDENLPHETASLFTETGHDAVTILDLRRGWTRTWTAWSRRW